MDVRRHPARLFEWKRQVCPKSPGDPSTNMPCSQTPAGLGARPGGSVLMQVTPRVRPSIQRSAVAFHTSPGCRPRERFTFRGSVTRPAGSLSTPVDPRSPPDHARLVWPAFPGRFCTWARSRGFRVASYISSPLLSFLGARRKVSGVCRARRRVPGGWELVERIPAGPLAAPDQAENVERPRSRQEGAASPMRSSCRSEKPCEDSSSV